MRDCESINVVKLILTNIIILIDLFRQHLTWVFWGIKILLTFSGYIILGIIVGICLC